MRWGYKAKPGADGEEPASHVVGLYLESSRRILRKDITWWVWIFETDWGVDCTTRLYCSTLRWCWSELTAESERNGKFPGTLGKTSQDLIIEYEGQTWEDCREHVRLCPELLAWDSGVIHWVRAHWDEEWTWGREHEFSFVVAGSCVIQFGVEM